ncbi:MAG TPA: GntR family transcriptional regulator [Erysipelothrix sp.]|jgi:DNA-binding GntR family transcriptional regulator|nr:GntR family transcriptional regulator [Erysipelothrix sp.]
MTKKLNRSQIVFNKIKNDILNGVYSPNESLKEVDVSEKYGISRNTLKMILVQLESEGLITIEPNKGAKVRNYSLDEVLDFLVVRSVLEGLIIRLSTEVVSDAVLEEMENTLAIMKGYLDNNDLVSYSKKNQVFHEYIYEACPNQVAVDLVRDLKTQMSKYNTRTILVPGRSDSSYQEHFKILEALKERDALKAQELMETHVLNVQKTFKENFSLLF